MSDIVERLLAHNSCGCGCSSDTRGLIAEAADEIVRLRALITEWASAELDNDFMHNDTAATRYVRAMDALREEANR